MTVRVRALVVLVVALLGTTVVVRAAWWLAGPPLLRGVDDRSLTDPRLATLLCAGCALALLGCVGWLLLTTTLTLVVYAARVLAPRHTGVEVVARAVERGCPRWLREVVAASLGLAISVAGAAPALAHPHHDRFGAAAGLDGLRLPDRTSGAALSMLPRRTVALRSGRGAGTSTATSTATRPTTQPTTLPMTQPTTLPTTQPRTVLVREGDSLWRIAAAHLPPDAGDAEVTEAWHRLRAVNAARIGADPDLIHPGDRLQLPDLSPAPRKDAP